MSDEKDVTELKTEDEFSDTEIKHREVSNNEPSFALEKLEVPNGTADLTEDETARKDKPKSSSQKIGFGRLGGILNRKQVNFDNKRDPTEEPANVVVASGQAKDIFETSSQVDEETKRFDSADIKDLEEEVFENKNTVVKKEDFVVRYPDLQTNNIDAEDLFAFASEERIHRLHYRCLYFAKGGEIQYYEKRSDKDVLDSFIEDIREQNTESDRYKITSRAALRSWLLNSPFPYKVHKRYKERIAEAITQSEDNPAPTAEAVDPILRSRIEPYDFLNVTERIALDLKKINVADKAFIDQENDETTSQKIKQLSEGAVSKSTNAESTQPNEEEKGDFVKTTWLHNFGLNNKRTIADYAFLDRMFVYSSTRQYQGRQSNNKLQTKVYCVQDDLTFEANNEEDLSSSDLNGIYIGTMLVSVFDEQYICEQRKNGQFTEKLLTLTTAYGLCDFVSFIHQQYGFRKNVETSNFWRDEIYRGFDELVERRYVTHTLNDCWCIDEGVPIKTLSFDDKTKILNKEVFSNKMISVEDMFGQHSPLYFKGNVTYILLYDKEKSLNMKYTKDADVLGIITKIEEPVEVDIIGNSTSVKYSKTQRAREKRSRLLNQMRLLRKKNLTEDDEEIQRQYTDAERVTERRRRARVPSFDDLSSCSSSDSDDSILTQSDTELEDYAADLATKLALFSSPRKARASRLKTKEKVELRGGALDEEKTQDESNFTDSVASGQSDDDVELNLEDNKNEFDKVYVEDSEYDSLLGSVAKGLGRHKASLFLMLLGVLSLLGVVYFSSSLEQDGLSIEEETNLYKWQFICLGVFLFFAVLAFCLFVIKEFRDKHLIDSRTNFKESALEGKNFVLSNYNVERDVADRKKVLNYEEGIKMRKNHRVIVLLTNLVPGQANHNATDTAYTAESSLGNITRIADCSFRVEFELTNDAADIQGFVAEKDKDDLTWRYLKVSSIREMFGKNFRVTDVVHFAENEEIEQVSARKMQTTIQAATILDDAALVDQPNSSKSCWLFPSIEFRHYFSQFSVFISLFSLYLIFIDNNKFGWNLMSLNILSAVIGSWENPISSLLSLYFSMHYGASGAPVGKLLISSHARTYSQSKTIYIYSILVSFVPLVFFCIDLVRREENGEPLFSVNQEEMTKTTKVLALIIGLLTILSNITVLASFNRRFFLESLEIMSHPVFLFKPILAFYYVMEWLNLRMETCLFIFNISKTDSRLLLSELSDLGKFFTAGDEEKATKRNGFGVPLGINERSQNALWGLIDKKTRKEVVLSPVDPGFKSVSFQASGIHVFTSIYYATNFFRYSVVGLRYFTANRLKKEGAQIEEIDWRVNKIKTTTKIRKNPTGYQPTGSSPIIVFFYHLFFMFLILFETLFYLPTFSLFLSTYFLSTIISSLLLLPIGIIYLIREKFFQKDKDYTKISPSNCFSQTLALYVVTILTLQLTITLWIKTIVVLFNLVIKILFSIISRKQFQFFVTPKLSLFFQPPSSVTHINSKCKIQRKRIFKQSEAGYWTGEVPFFAEIPLFPKAHAINLVLADCREPGDRIVRSKMRSHRDDTIGLVEREYIDEVGLSR